MNPIIESSNSSNNFNSKAILARLMSTENLRVEQHNVSTASFNLMDRILSVPVLDSNISDDLYNLFMGHECGHALWTPVDFFKTTHLGKLIPPSILNVVEDSRIERKIKDKYPGLKTNFFKGYSELLERDFFGLEEKIKEKGVKKVFSELNLIDKINLVEKGVFLYCLEFPGEEFALLEEVRNTETREDVFNVSMKILEYMENRKEKTNKDPMEKNKNEGENKENKENEENEENNSSLESETDKAFQENKETLFLRNPDQTRTLYLDVPEVPDSGNIIMDYKTFYRDIQKNGNLDNWIENKESENNLFTIREDRFKKIESDCKSTISFLVKEFELRKNASLMKRNSIKNLGEIAPEKLFSHKFCDDIFKKTSMEGGGKNHGLLIFLDWSGSMTFNLEHTFQELLCILHFCRKVGIKFEVYAFSDWIKGGPFGGRVNPFDEFLTQEQIIKEHTIKIKEETPPERNTLKPCKFQLFQLFSWKMGKTEFCRSEKLAYDLVFKLTGCSYVRDQGFVTMGGTPLNETIMFGMDFLEIAKKNMGYPEVMNVLFLTDGESNRNTYREGGSGIVLDMAYVPGTYGYGVSKIVFRDPKTGEEVSEVWNKMGGVETTRLTTVALLKLLRRRGEGGPSGGMRKMRKNNDTNLLGVYLVSDIRKGLTSLGYSRGSDSLKKNEKEWSINKNLILSDPDRFGFDEYYLLPGRDKDGVLPYNGMIKSKGGVPGQDSFQDSFRQDEMKDEGKTGKTGKTGKIMTGGPSGGLVTKYIKWCKENKKMRKTLGSRKNILIRFVEMIK